MGVSPPPKAKACREFTNLREIPDYQSLPDFFVHILERQDSQITHLNTLAFRESPDAIRGFAGDDLEEAKYFPESKDFLLEFMPRVVHREGGGQP